MLIDGLSKAYNRLDILYILRYLEEEGIVHRVDAAESKLMRPIDQLTLEDEARTFWELGLDFDWQGLA